MEVVGILTLFFVGITMGAWCAVEYVRLRAPDREATMAKQINALQTALQISQQAWAARSAMHQEADRIRRQDQSGGVT